MALENQRPDQITINGVDYGEQQTKALITFVKSAQQSALKGGHFDVSVTFSHIAEWMTQTAGRWFGKHKMDFSVYISEEGLESSQDAIELAAATATTLLKFMLPASYELFHVEKCEPTGTYSITGDAEWRVTVAGTDRAISILTGAMELMEAHDDVLSEIIPETVA